MGEPIWGGRFADPPDPDLLRLTRSTGVDMRLLPYDLRATRAHARALVDAALLDRDDLARLDDACAEILSEWEAGALSPTDLDEDVHSFVERELTERLGDPGRRIHAGRSRNDLVAQDLRLWCSDAAGSLAARTAVLIETLARRAEEHVDDVMPGYTHLQRAQPVSVGFYLVAHAAALARDVARFDEARRAADVALLGAGALAGTTLPIDPGVAARELGLRRSFLNAMDAVSDRDFVCDLVYACAVCGIHLSKIAEEVVLFSSTEFGYVKLPDAWSTGSSMMPQKRNPDAAELVRGRGAVGVGDLTSLLAVLKGLPLAYDRDLQEDKEILFRTVDRVDGSLEMTTQLVGRLEFRTQRLEAACSVGEMWATDVAEAAVLSGVPFREAHAATGRAMGPGQSGVASEGSVIPEGWTPRDSIAKRSHPGCTDPTRVREQIATLREMVSPWVDTDM